MADYVDFIGAARLLIAATLIAAAGLKVWNSDALREFLGDLGIPERLRASAAWLVVVTEGAVAAALLTAHPVVAGAATAILFAGFSLVVLLRPEGAKGCGCMGALSRSNASTARKELPRIGAVVAGVAIAFSDPAATWLSPAAIALTATGLAGYLGYVALQQALAPRPMAESGSGRAEVLNGAESSGLELALAEGVPTVTPVTQHPGLPRRTFLGALAGLPAAVVAVPSVAWAGQVDRRHCGVGCGPNFQCWCCAEVAHEAPTCQCWPLSEDPPVCPPVCCDIVCCFLEDENCEDECILQRDACDDLCPTLCFTSVTCSACYQECAIEEAACRLNCDVRFILCQLSVCDGSEADPQPAVPAEMLV